MNNKEFHELIEVIRGAGEKARTYFDSGNIEHEQKEDNSVVTKIDGEIETILLKYIRARFPEDSIVGEEHGNHEGTSEFVWHVDPIDATDNFLRKIPFCAVSVARLGDGPEGSLGIVHNPITGQVFAATMDNDAYENERLCNLTAETLGGRLVVSIGAGRSEDWMTPAKFALFKEGSAQFGKFGQYGCTALELAYVAASRIDGYLTYGLKSYDYAAGLFLAKAAGAAISVFIDGAWQRWEGSIKELCQEHGRILFVSHPDVHQEVVDFIGDPKVWAQK